MTEISLEACLYEAGGCLGGGEAVRMVSSMSKGY